MPLSLQNYQERSKRTLPKIQDKQALANYAMGLAGESGEVVDVLKKHIFHGHELDKDALREELGDVLHYLSGLCTLTGLTLEEVASENIDKLLKRYPYGFSEKASQERAK